MATTRLTTATAVEVDESTMFIVLKHGEFRIEDFSAVSALPGIGYASDWMDKPKILTAKELRAIMPRLAGWKLANNKLSRTLEFQDFVHSLSFVNSLVAYFETVDHHPDVRIAFGEVTFELTRYDLGGKVTDRDVEVAKKISSVYRARS